MSRVMCVKSCLFFIDFLMISFPSHRVSRMSEDYSDPGKEFTHFKVCVVS